MDKIKLLISARDPATAYAFKILIDELILDVRFDVYVVAQAPAYEILSELDHNILIKVDDFGGEIEPLFMYTKEMVRQVQPDIVLTGISGPDLGIDEVLLSVVDKSDIRTFSLQSYWGDLNEGIGCYANTIFVLDDFAAELTRERIKAECIVVGSLKHQDYKEINVPEMRAGYRNNIGATDEQVIICFFGQPLIEYEWYKKTILEFAVSCQKVMGNAILVYRAHPKETVESREWTMNVLKNKTSRFIYDHEKDIETVLAGCDTVVSCFSTCGYDLQQLMYASDYAPAVPLYLFYNPDLRSWYKEYCKLNELPLTKFNLATSVQSISALDESLIAATKTETKLKCLNDLKVYLASPMESSSKMLDYMYNSK